MAVPVVFRKNEDTRMQAGVIYQRAVGKQQEIGTGGLGVWENLDDMNKTFKLDAQSTVLITVNYGVFYDGTAAGTVWTLLDGEQLGLAQEFTHEGVENSHYYTMTGSFTLEEGTHTIQIQGQRSAGTNNWYFMDGGSITMLIFDNKKATKYKAIV